MFKSDSMSYLGFGKEGKGISGLESFELCLRVNLDNALRGHVYEHGLPIAKESTKPLGRRHFEELYRSEFVEQLLRIREQRGLDVQLLRFSTKYKYHFFLDTTGELFKNIVTELSNTYPENFHGDPESYRLYLLENITGVKFKEGFFSSYDDVFEATFLKVLDAVLYLIEKEYKIGNADVLLVAGDTMFDEKPFLLNCYTLLEVDLNTKVEMTKLKGRCTWDLYKGFV